MTEPDADEIASVMDEKNWRVERNGFDLWVMGPVDEEGTMEVLGMGRSILEAFRMARGINNE